AELFGERVDPPPHVALKGEARVLEPALEHVLVPGADDLRVAAVRDDREPVPPEREVPLVCLHRRLDHALGEREIALVEAPLEHERPLDEVDHLAQDARRVAPLAERVEAFADQALPLGRARRNPPRVSTPAGSTPCLRAKPAAACSRRDSGGPFTHSSAVRSGSPSTSTPSRRGPT